MVSAFIDRITTVLREHEPTGSWRSSLGHECLCRHWAPGPASDNSALKAHVAEWIEAATTPHPRCCVCGPDGDETHGCCLHDSEADA